MIEHAEKVVYPKTSEKKAVLININILRAYTCACALPPKLF
jgi:hypothetical protein